MGGALRAIRTPLHLNARVPRGGGVFCMGLTELLTPQVCTGPLAPELRGMPSLLQMRMRQPSTGHGAAMLGALGELQRTPCVRAWLMRTGLGRILKNGGFRSTSICLPVGCDTRGCHDLNFPAVKCQPIFLQRHCNSDAFLTPYFCCHLISLG